MTVVKTTEPDASAAPPAVVPFLGSLSASRWPSAASAGPPADRSAHSAGSRADRAAHPAGSGRVGTSAPDRSASPASTSATRRDPSPPSAPLSPLELLHLARERAVVTPSWPDQSSEPLDHRRYELVEVTEVHEVWVIHWPTGGRLELHDHGSSNGAFWVRRGGLHERHVRDDGTLGQRDVTEGGGEAFGTGYVHDVWNIDAQPATSVHAYSPPLASMTFYRRGSAGLAAERTEHRRDGCWAP